MNLEKFKGDFDQLHAVGAFALMIIDVSSGNIMERFAENNLVVSLGQKNLARLLGGDASGKSISKIGIGTNGVTPNLGDTALVGSFSKSISGASYPEANSVLFTWSIDASEGNGMTIREFGLLNGDGILCARKVRTDIVKTASVRLVGSWKITIN
jgi:hypothetical protein